MAVSDAAPQTGGPNRPRGIVHAHSTRSFDGQLSYPELRALFTGHGLQFACMTEHIEHLGQADIDAIVEDCRAHSDGDFVFVPGIEMDCFVIYFLGIERTAVDFSSNRAIFDSLRPTARLLVLSHPIKAGYRYPDWLRTDCDAVELLNARHDGKFYYRPGSERLWRGLRRDRPEVVGLAGLDFHGPRDLCPIHIRLETHEPLSETAVCRALKAGAFELMHGDAAFSGFGPLQRAAGRARIRAMDAAHTAHRALRRSGLKVPSGLRRRLAGVIEGSR
jgi:hypothetical protein